MMISKNDQDSLWKSIVDCNFKEFERARSSMGDDESKRYPVRVLTLKDNLSNLFTVSKGVNLGEFIDQCHINELKEVKEFKVIIQGCEPSMDTPMEWLVHNCSHPDSFLYV